MPSDTEPELLLPEYPPIPQVRDTQLPPRRPPHLPIAQAGKDLISKLSHSLLDGTWKLPQRIDDLLNGIRESSSAIAEVLADLQDENEDPEFLKKANELLERNDRKVRQLVDAKAYLEAMRAEVEKAKIAAGEEGEDRKGPSVCFEKGADEWYQKYVQKTSYEKYANAKEYLEYRRAIWELQHVDTGKAMPPVKQWFPEDGARIRAGVQADEDSDDEIEMSAMKVSAKCGLTLKYFENAVTNTCGHSFEKNVIMEMVRKARDNKCECPTPGCKAVITEKSLKRNQNLDRMAKRAKEREEERLFERELEEESDEDGNEGGDDEDMVTSTPPSGIQVKKEQMKRKTTRNVVIDDSD